MFSYAIKSGDYDGVKLDGLVFTCAKGQGGHVWYVDRRATPEQAAALQAIAERIVPVRHVSGDDRGRYARAGISAGITPHGTEHRSSLHHHSRARVDNT